MSPMTPVLPELPRRRWARAYMRLRRAEGRGAGGEAELLALPYLTAGPLAGQWAIRARTFDAFVRRVVAPLAAERARPLAVLDLGAGNGWLSARLARLGHRCVALDLRVDDADGLAAGAPFRRHLPRMFGRVSSSFDALPFGDALFDLVVFDASLHLAEDLPRGPRRGRARYGARGTRRYTGLALLRAVGGGGSHVRGEAARHRADVSRPRRGSPRACAGRVPHAPRASPRPPRPRACRSRGAASSIPSPTRRAASGPALLGKRPPSRFDLWSARRA